MLPNIGTIRIHKDHGYVDRDMEEACLKVLRSRDYYMGAETDQFEADLASAVNAKHAVTANSGSSAMFLTLRALGIGPGDEVIVPAMGFVTIAEAVANVGARPRFVDIESRTYNLDPAQLEGAMTPSVRAVMPAHNYGHPANMDAIMEFANRYDLKVIEDCAHGLGARHRGRVVGTIGDAGFTSFAGKTISVCGLGGAVLTNDDRIASEVRLLRDHGRPRSKGVRSYEIQRVGHNMRLSELHAAVGRVQLRHLGEWNRRRRETAAYYSERFGGGDLPIICPEIHGDVEHSFLHYTIRVDASKRDGLQRSLAARGIQAAVLYPIELFLLTPYREAWGHKPGEFPTSELVTREILSLPNHPSVTDEMREEVVAAVHDFFRDQQG